ncbi:MAG: hypothetical protein WC659_00270 [Patescibacteria group bacterium]
MKKQTAFLAIMIVLFLLPIPIFAARTVKTAGSSTVYYVDDGGVRHAYPNQHTYRSWFGGTLRQAQGDKLIETVKVEELAGIALGKNVTMRPGSLVKIPTAPQVYAVEAGGILRPIVGEQTAIDLWGKDWAKKVIDMPEVFFSDYQIGKSVRGRADLPDGTLVKLETPPSEPPLGKGGTSANYYYFKDKGVLRPFKDVAAVKENRLDTSVAVVIPQLFPIRTRVISGLESRIVEPQWDLLINSVDCEAANLRAAVIYLSRGSGNTVTKLNLWRTSVASSWERRTDVLSLISIDPVEEMVLEDRFLGSTTLEMQEISRTFFDTHRDVYDFLFVWNPAVPVNGTKELADFWPVTNQIDGLGKAAFERGELYGSKGKLKAVINMGRPGDYPIDDTAGMARAVETGLHELLHQWSGEADYKDSKGADRTDLQTADGYHWSPLADLISPLGGWGWRDNGDGTLTSKRSLYTTQQLADLHFPDLDLYLMGLVPRHSVAPFSYIVPTAAGVSLTDTVVGTLRSVSIDDVVYGNGVRRCTNRNMGYIQEIW